MSDPDFFRSCVVELASRSKRLLNTASQNGAQYADLFLEQSDTSALRANVTAFGGSAPAFQSHEQPVAGVAIRAFNGQRHHLKAVEGWHPGSLNEAADEVAQVQGLSAGEMVRVSPDVNPQVTWVDDLPADAPHLISMEEKQNLLSNLIETAFSCEPSIVRCEIEYKDITRRTLLINSTGQSLASEQARLGIRVAITLGGAENVQMYATRGYRGGFGQLTFNLPVHFVQQVVDRAKSLADARAIVSGVMPVVFAGGWGGLWLHEAAGHLLEADVAPDAMSMGNFVGNPELTIVDDPTLSGSQGSYLFDDEGVPAKQTVLIEKGRISSLMLDRYHASRLGRQSTGNGRRAHFGDIPLPRMTNLCLLAGEASRDELIASVKQGLFVRQATSGVHYNNAGTFEIQVLEGYRIEDGRLTYPVQNVVISGQPLQALQQVVGVGNDVAEDQGFGVCKKAGQVVPVSVNTPAVRIDGLLVKQDA